MDRRDPCARARKAARPRRDRVHLRGDPAEAVANGLVPPALRTHAGMTREGARADRPDQDAHPALVSHVRAAASRAYTSPAAPHPAPDEHRRPVKLMVLAAPAAEQAFREVQHVMREGG